MQHSPNVRAAVDTSRRRQRAFLWTLADYMQWGWEQEGGGEGGVGKSHHWDVQFSRLRAHDEPGKLIRALWLHINITSNIVCAMPFSIRHSIMNSLHTTRALLYACLCLSLCVCAICCEFIHPFLAILQRFGSHKMVYYNAAAMAVVEFCGRLASLTTPYHIPPPPPAPLKMIHSQIGAPGDTACHLHWPYIDRGA